MREIILKINEFLKMVQEHIKIRLAKKKDFNDFFSLRKEFINFYRKLSKLKLETPTKKFCRLEFNSRFGKNKFFYIADISNKVVAYLFGGIEANNHEGYGYIDDIFVSQKYQKKSISTQLKNKFIDLLKKKGIRFCKLDVNPRNKTAIKAYNSWGFKIDKYRMSLRIY